MLYDELYDESDFVMFALDFVDEPEELETLLDAANPTVILKVLSILKSKGTLCEKHKEIALKNCSYEDCKSFIEAL